MFRRASAGGSGPLDSDKVPTRTRSLRSLPRRRLGAEGGARQPESSTGVLYRVRGARSIVTRNADHARAQAAFGNLRGYNKSILETLAIYLRVLLTRARINYD